MQREGGSRLHHLGRIRVAQRNGCIRQSCIQHCTCAELEAGMGRNTDRVVQDGAGIGWCSDGDGIGWCSDGEGIEWCSDG